MILGWQGWIGLITSIVQLLYWRSIGESPNSFTANCIRLTILHCDMLRICRMLHCVKLPVSQQQFPCLWYTPLILRMHQRPLPVFRNHQCIHNLILCTLLFKRFLFIHVSAKHWLNIFVTIFFQPHLTITYCWNKMDGQSVLELHHFCG